MSNKWKLAVIGIVAGALILACLLIPAGSAGPVLPVPNGYDDFLNAARQAVTHRHLRYGDAADAELRQLVEENRSALTLSRAGLARECRVTTDYNLTLAVYSSQHLPDLAQFKKLALAFRAEGELAEREGRTNDAARIYLDGIQFGQKACRGGLVIDRLVGMACERTCFDPVKTLVQGLDGQTCQELAQLLERLEANREPMQVTWNEERIWVARAGGISERLKNLIGRIVQRRALQAMRQKMDPKLTQLQLEERDLMLQMAARAYQLRRGTAPQRTGDLVPEYLREIPKHPVTGQELTLD